MSEHSAARDRISWLVQQIGEPGSDYLREQAEAFVNGLSESGYLTWLRCVVEVQERGLFQANDLQDHDRQLWLTLLQETRDILTLAAACISGDRLTEQQQALLDELQQEQEIEPDPALDLHDLRLLAELAEAKAWDEVGRQRGPVPQQPKAKTSEAPTHLQGTPFESSPRHWPRKTGWGAG